MLRVCTIIIALITLSILTAEATAKPKLTLSIADKAVVKGIVAIVATVDASSIVTNVTFQIDGETRFVDQSTPYEFEWDTIPETEGEHALKIVVLTEEETEAYTYKVTVDNELNKGLEHFLAKAKEALSEAKWDDVMLYARLAEKIKPNSPDAALYQSRAYLGKNLLGDARRTIEKALLNTPNDIPLLELHAQIQVKRGMLAQTQDMEREAFIEAVKSRHKSYDNQIKALQTSKDPLASVDLLFSKGDFSLAWEPLKKELLKNSKDIYNQNRLIYAYMRGGLTSQAMDAAQKVLRLKIDDDYTHTLLSLLYAIRGEFNKAGDEIQTAARMDPESPYIRFAQAYLALQKRNWTSVASLMTELINEGYVYPEIYYYMMLRYTSVGDWENARVMMGRVLEQEPGMLEVFIQRAWENLLTSRRPEFKGQIDNAMHFFNVAYSSKGSLVDSLVGLAFIYAYQGQWEKALSFTDGAMKIAGERTWVLVSSAAVYYKASSFYFEQSMAATRNDDAEKAAIFRKTSADLEKKAATIQKQAFAMDSVNVTGMTPYPLDAAVNFAWRWGRPPVFIPPSKPSSAVANK